MDFNRFFQGLVFGELAQVGFLAVFVVWFAASVSKEYDLKDSCTMHVDHICDDCPYA